MTRIVALLLPCSLLNAQDPGEQVAVEILNGIRTQVVRAAAYGQKLSACNEQKATADNTVRSIEKEQFDNEARIPTLNARRATADKQANSGKAELRLKAAEELQSIERQIAEANAVVGAKRKQLVAQLTKAQSAQTAADRCFRDADSELQKIIGGAAAKPTTNPSKPAAVK